MRVTILVWSGYVYYWPLGQLVLLSTFSHVEMSWGFCYQLYKSLLGFLHRKNCVLCLATDPPGISACMNTSSQIYIKIWKTIILLVLKTIIVSNLNSYCTSAWGCLVLLQIFCDRFYEYWEENNIIWNNNIQSVEIFSKADDLQHFFRRICFLNGSRFTLWITGQ